jgi:uncharacterized coiled-coil DUF342 family protein
VTPEKEVVEDEIKMRIDAMHAQIITLREQRDRLMEAAKWYLEHPMDAEGVNLKAAARLWNIIREVEAKN